MVATFGYQSQLGIDSVNPVTKRFDFDSEEIVCDEEFIDTNGLRGTRSRSEERIRQGIRRIHGHIRMQPTAAELALLLPWILGGTPSGTGTLTYPLADQLSANYITVDRGAKVFTYNGCVCDAAKLHAAQNQPLSLDLEVVGIDETVAAAGTFPSLALDISTSPFIFMDLALTVNGVQYFTKSFELDVRNEIEKERFFNSQTLTQAYAKDRHVTLSHPLPFGDDFAAYNLGVGGVVAEMVFSATTALGTQTLTIVANNVKYPRHSPRVEGHEEIMLPMQGTCYRTGTAPSGSQEILVTLAT